MSYRSWSRRMASSLLVGFAVCFAAVENTTGQGGDLPRSNITMQSVLRVDLSRNIATVPLYEGRVRGQTVWFVLMDASDEASAREFGLNFAPRLANASNGCPACVQTVRVNNGIVDFTAGVDFSPARILVPGPRLFPPLTAQPGSVAQTGYSDLARVEGSSVVFNAPIVATGTGPFDVITHSNTLDRVMSIDIARRTVDLLFIRAFSHGRDIFYFSFGSSGGVSAVFERGTFVPVLSGLPFQNASEHPRGARGAIFAFANGQRGRTSPPAQGLMHVIADGFAAQDAHLQNTALIEALVAGGDSHNVLDFFTTLRDPALARLYTPMWDLQVGEWSPEAVASGQNVAQTDANVIRQLAVRRVVTSPGGVQLHSSNAVVNCPILGFLDQPPTEPQAPKPASVTIPVP